MKITAGTITTYNDIDAGAVYQNVPWEVTDDEDAVLVQGHQSFPLTASADEIRDFLTRCLAVYKSDQAIGEASRELQAGLDNAAVVSAEVSGVEISAEPITE